MNDDDQQCAFLNYLKRSNPQYKTSYCGVKKNNKLITDNLSMVGKITTLGNSDVNGIFTVSKNSNGQYILKKTTVDYIYI